MKKQKPSYIQYFEQSRSYTDSEWESILSAAHLTVKHFADGKEVSLVEDHYTTLPPLLNDTLIQFNGYTKLGQETFCIYKDYCWSREQCKTQKKPYDLPVCIILLAIYSITPEVLTIKSDGSWEKDWKEAKLLYHKLFQQRIWYKKQLSCPWGVIDDNATHNLLKDTEEVNDKVHNNSNDFIDNYDSTKIKKSNGDSNNDKKNSPINSSNSETIADINNNEVIIRSNNDNSVENSDNVIKTDYKRRVGDGEVTTSNHISKKLKESSKKTKKKKSKTKNNEGSGNNNKNNNSEEKFTTLETKQNSQNRQNSPKNCNNIANDKFSKSKKRSKKKIKKSSR